MSRRSLRLERAVSRSVAEKTFLKGNNEAGATALAQVQEETYIQESVLKATKSARTVSGFHGAA